MTATTTRSCQNTRNKGRGRRKRERAANSGDVPGLRERQPAENARYQKAVDAAYQQAARDAWTKAVPELRAAWEEHKQRYPERARSAARIQPDGSWAGDGGRRLTPEQNAGATKCCTDLRDEADQVIRPALDRVAAADPSRHLTGLERLLSPTLESMMVGQAYPSSAEVPDVRQ